MNESRRSNEFLALITPCRGRLLGYLYSLLHSMDDAEDVLQQAVLAMWRHFDEYDGRRSFLNWAMRFCELTALNHIRSKRRSRVIFSDDLVLMLAERFSRGDDAESESEEAYRDVLLQCMDRLTEPARDLIRQCYFEKCRITQAAQRLGRTPQSVCNSLRRIRGLLLDCIQTSLPPECDA